MNVKLIFLLLFTIILSSCSNSFEIQENSQELIVSNSNEVIEESKEDVLDETLIEIDEVEEKIEESQVENVIEEKILSSEISDLEFELNKKYNLEYRGKSYEVEFYEDENNLKVIIDGVEMNLDSFDLIFNFDNKELKFYQNDESLILELNQMEVTSDEDLDIKLELEVEDEYIKLEWEDELDSLKWYKVMHSTINSDPKYPQDAAVWVLENWEEKEFIDHSPVYGTNYYRITGVLEGDEYVHSNVIKVDFNGFEEEKEESYEELIIDEITIDKVGDEYILTAVAYLTQDSQEIEYEKLELSIINNDIKYTYDYDEEREKNDEFSIYSYTYSTQEREFDLQPGEKFDFELVLDEEIDLNEEIKFLIETHEGNYFYKYYQMDLELELTDSFDFWNDQESHAYEVFGTTGSGAYVCDGEQSYSDFNYQSNPREDFNSLRLSNCAVSDEGSVYLEMEVNPSSEKVMISLKEAFGNRDFNLEIDGVDFGNFVSGNKCINKEYYFDNMKEYTEDGILEILISDGVVDSCEGDPQLSFIEIYS